MNFPKLFKLKENKYFLAFFPISLLYFSLWVMAFWPANMSPDSMSFWAQATTSEFDNLHPYLFSLFIKFLNFFSQSPATLIVFQTILFSVLISFFLQFLLKKGANKFIIYSSFGGLLLFFPIALYNTMFWNDVLYSYLILLTAIIFVVVNFKTESKNLSPAAFFSLIILTFAISSLRHNGIIYLFFLPLVFYLYKIINHKKAFLFLFIVISLFLVQSFPLKNVFNVTDSSKILPQIPKAKVIGRAIKNGIVYSPSDEQFLLKVAPKEVWNNYVCYNDYSLFWDARFNTDLLKSETNLANWNRIFMQTIKTQPQIFVGDRLCLAINQLGGQNMFFLGITGNDFDLKTQTLNQSANKFLTDLIIWSGKKPQRFLIWSPGIFIFLNTVALIYSFRKKMNITLAYILINCSNILLIFLVTTSAEYRYLYSIIPSTFLLPGLLSAEYSIKKEAKKK